MAEAVETALVELAVKKLVNIGYGTIRSVTDLEYEVKRLQDTRTLIESALIDADTMSEQYNRAQINTAEKLSCELDRLLDFLDARATRELQKELMGGSNFIKEARLFFSASNQLVARFKDAREVKEIRKKLNSITIDHAQIGRISCFPSPSQTRAWSIQRAATSHDIITDLVIGRDDDKDNIVSMLSEDEDEEALSVVSIFGIGGMGKTTLAWYVYSDERVKCCFDVQFWVPTTQDFDLRKVLENIIASSACGRGIGELPPNVCDMDQLFHHFRRAIGGKKFLLVLDNVWDHECLRQKWIDLRSLLAFGANGSKVLLTTRNKKVVEIMDSSDSYKLGYLNEDHTWLLFQKFAFTQLQDPGVEAIGKEIAKLCPNVPLVIRSIGGLLARKHTIQEWQTFREDQLANFASYGSEIMRTLKLSYDHLDARLKLCVTYCTLFEKGGLFHLEQMINRWVALGYVEPQYRNQSLEEAGEQYMFILCDCGFLKISNHDTAGIRWRFSMENVMYELVLSLAGFKYKVADSKTDKIDERVRHLSIGEEAVGSYWEVPSSVFKIKHLQSLTRGNSFYSGKIKISLLLWKAPSSETALSRRVRQCGVY
ncbi:hypothetical protein SOVF_058910 [Spinacia oleracea]|nr:hypothetical protein SOVF_058910 [Spinacia oleracea]